MKKLLIIIAVAVSGFVNGQDYGDSLATKDFISAETVEYWIVRYINEERTKLGLDTLVYDSEIDDMAKTHSEWMLRTGKFEHSKNNVYEIILTGGNGTTKYNRYTHKFYARAVVNGWMNSSGHKYIITLAKLQYIGVGFSYSIRSSDGYITKYYTATFR